MREGCQRLVAAGRAGNAGERVLPRLEQLAHLQVERVLIRFGMTAVDANDQVDARQRTLAEGGIVGRGAAAIGVGQQTVRAGAEFRIVAVTRRIKQRRNIAVEAVATDEQARSWPQQQAENARGDAFEIGFGNLEEFVSRIGFEHQVELFLREARALRCGRFHILDLAADQRHFVGGADIGLRGEQADEAGLANDVPACVIAFDADIVGMAAAMDAGDETGLGHDDGRRLVDQGAHGWRQHGGLCAARQHVAFVIAQDAEARGFIDDRLLGGEAAILVDREGVVACAEIGEVLVRQPGEEGARLVDLSRGAAARGFHAGEFGRDGFHLLAHGVEIGVHHGDVGEGVFQALLQFGAQVIVEQRQMNLDGGAVAFGAGDNRVQHGADLDLGFLAGDDGAVDEEGQVGADDLGDIQPQRPIARADGAPHADGAAVIGFVLAVEVPQAKREDGGVFRRQREEVLHKGVGAILVEEVQQRGIVLLLRRQRAVGGKQVIPRKGEFVGQGKLSGRKA